MKRAYSEGISKDSDCERAYSEESEESEPGRAPKAPKKTDAPRAIMPLAELLHLLIEEYLPADAAFALALTCREAYARDRPSLGAAMAASIFHGHDATLEWMVEAFAQAKEPKHEGGAWPDPITRERYGLEQWAARGKHPPSYEWEEWDSELWPAWMHIERLGPRAYAWPASIFVALARNERSVALIAPWLRYVTYQDEISFEPRGTDLPSIFYAILRTGNIDHAATFHAIMTKDPLHPMEDVALALYHAGYHGEETLDAYWRYMLPGWEMGDDGAKFVLTLRIYGVILSQYWNFSQAVQRFFCEKVFGDDNSYMGRHLAHPPLADIVQGCRRGGLRALVVVLYHQCCRSSVRTPPPPSANCMFWILLHFSLRRSFP